MRITNSMMTANTKANLNINKLNADKLNTMTASGQKITRPSDDPVVAIRAMRLNTSLTELNQYHGKNIPDAEAWFTDTETALSQADDILSNIREKLNQASSEENVTSNVLDILEELKQLKQQFYATGNADSAGRTVFTGYRTGEMLTFLKDDEMQYIINEDFKIEDLDKMDYVSGKRDVNKATIMDPTYLETSVISNSINRIRLSYGSNDEITPTVKVGGTSIPVNVITEPSTGLTQAQKDAAYGIKNGINYIPKTGELIIGDDVYAKIKAAGGLSIEYSKTNWVKGDLRPEHYFMCKTPATGDERTYSSTYPYGNEYNFNRVVTIDGEEYPTTDPTGMPKGFIEQELTYEIAYNQSLAINTHASETFSHSIGRDIDELQDITESLAGIENKIKDIQAKVDESKNTPDEATYKNMLAAAEKERVLMKEKMHGMYTAAITSFKNYSDKLNERISALGAYTARLEMTKNRVKDQQTNVKKLADENINADLTETALDYKNAQLALEAAQLAAGKIANQTLLNYI